MTQPKVTTRFVMILAVYIAALIASNVVAPKAVSVGPFTADAGTLTFPLAFITADLLTELYGPAIARAAVNAGAIVGVMCIGIYLLAVALPSANTEQFDAGFRSVFIQTPRIFVASMIAFYLGSMWSVSIMAGVKRITEGRMLWLRLGASIVTGHVLDAVLFIALAFAGVFPISILWQMVYTKSAIKIIVAVAAIPAVYAILHRFRIALQDVQSQGCKT